jgi:hypothetical protein
LGSGGIGPYILNLNARLRQVFSFSHHPLYPKRKKNPGILPFERLGESQNKSEYFSEKNTLLSMLGTEP